jgi:tRNA A-37 threonylcarbamoyl transferase component Bud32
MLMTSDGAAPRTVGERYVLVERISASTPTSADQPGPHARSDVDVATEVWQAHDDVVSRAVAVKLFAASGADLNQWQQRFDAGASALMTLSHPSIAKVHDHGSDTAGGWLAMSLVGGRTLADILADGAMTTTDALNVVGQVGFALQAAHDAGIEHGAVSDRNVLVRDQRTATLVGFAPGRPASVAADLADLADMARSIPASADADVADFLDWLDQPERSSRPRDAAEIARTALAVAASLDGRHATSVVPKQAPAAVVADDRLESVARGIEPRYDEAQRKMVRNRLIILGAIVVIGGGILLRFVGEGGGEVPVPSVVGLPINQAKLDLTSAGLRSSDTLTTGSKDSGGTVVAQSPTAGQEVKAGSTIALTVSTGR